MNEKRHLAFEILCRERRKSKFLFAGLFASLLTNVVLATKMLR